MEQQKVAQIVDEITLLTPREEGAVPDLRVRGVEATKALDNMTQEEILAYVRQEIDLRKIWVRDPVLSSLEWINLEQAIVRGDVWARK